MKKVEILNKLNQINKLREIEKKIGLSEFQRGQLSGVQQALAFVCGQGDPVRASLTDEQMWKAFNMLEVDKPHS